MSGTMTAVWKAPVVTRFDFFGVDFLRPLHDWVFRQSHCGNNPLAWTDPFGLFRFGKRGFQVLGITFSGFLLQNPLFDMLNIEVAHEQGFFDDEDSNVGFGPNGMMDSEKRSDYEMDSTFYDDATMRQAVNNLWGKEGKWNVMGDPVPLNKNNCQDWADRARAEYQRIMEKKRTCP